MSVAQGRSTQRETFRGSQHFGLVCISHILDQQANPEGKINPHRVPSSGDPHAPISLHQSNIRSRPDPSQPLAVYFQRWEVANRCAKCGKCLPDDVPPSPRADGRCRRFAQKSFANSAAFHMHGETIKGDKAIWSPGSMSFSSPAFLPVGNFRTKSVVDCSSKKLTFRPVVTCLSNGWRA